MYRQNLEAAKQGTNRRRVVSQIVSIPDAPQGSTRAARPCLATDGSPTVPLSNIQAPKRSHPAEAGWVGAAHKPSSVPRFGHPRRSGDHSSRPTVTGGLERSTCGRGRAVPDAHNSTLHPCGVCLADPVSRAAGALLPHPFNLADTPEGAPRSSPGSRARQSDACVAVCSLLHLPPGHPDRALPGTLPWGARTFLPRPRDRGLPHGPALSPAISSSTPTRRRYFPRRHWSIFVFFRSWRCG